MSKKMGGQNTLRKGCWSEEEDRLLKKYVEEYGQGNWKHIPTKAGLNRCRKSCRLRWLNYLRPNIKRGDFSVDENDLIIKLHRLLGNRWSLIAGRISGRTANDVKNYWNSYLSKKVASESKNMKKTKEDHNSDVSPMNSGPSEGERDSDRKIEREEDYEEGSDTTSFWKSLLLEGEFLENKETMKEVEEDEYFKGYEDLVQDMDFLVEKD